MKSIIMLAMVIMFGALAGCDEKSTGSTNTPSFSNDAIVGDWSYGRLRDSMFDSAKYSFQKNGSMSAVGVFNLIGAYYQIVYQNGTWKSTSESLTVAIDTVYETRDYGKTFKPMASKSKPISIGYYVMRDELGLMIKDDDGTIDTLKLKKLK